MIRAAVIIALACCANAALAFAPDSSMRPVQRGGNPLVQPMTLGPTGAIEQPAQDEAQEAAKQRPGLFSSLRPLFRTNKVARAGREQQRLREKGAVCGDIAIQGENVGKVAGRIQGCGIENAVQIRSVSGIGFTQRAVMDCTTAKAVKTWIENSAKPALANTGGGLKSLRVAAHYACRTRNNQKGARISEHGRGRAIDISGFRLADGTEFDLLSGWNNKKYAGALRRMHKGACGPFGTVLGPDADRFHRDHFHFDTARYRSGSYCR